MRENPNLKACEWSLILRIASESFVLLTRSVRAESTAHQMKLSQIVQTVGSVQQNYRRTIALKLVQEMAQNPQR